MLKRVLMVTTLFLATLPLSPSYADMPNTETDIAILKIDFHVKPERLAEFMNIMKGVDSAMQGEEGFRFAKVYVNMDDAGQITLIEGWETRALHEKHYQAINENGVWPMILEMQATAPLMGYFNHIPGN